MGPSRIAAKITRWLPYPSQSSGPCPGSSPGSIVSVVERSEGGGGGREKQHTNKIAGEYRGRPPIGHGVIGRQDLPCFCSQPSALWKRIKAPFQLTDVEAGSTHQAWSPCLLASIQCLEKRRVNSAIQLELPTDLDSELQSPCVHHMDHPMACLLQR